MHILRLPNEILDKIFECFTDNKQEAYWALCLSCRRLHELCTPRLYTSLTIGVGDNKEYQAEAVFKQLVILLSSLSKHPEYVALYKHISIGPILPQVISSCKFDDDGLLEYLCLIADRLFPADDSGYPSWNEELKKDIRRGHIEAVLCAFLAACPNLQELHTYIPHGIYRWLFVCIEHDFRRVFPNLQRARLSHRHEGIEWRDVVTLIKIPSITSLTAQVKETSHHQSLEPSNYSNVQHLSLVHSCLSGPVINDALRFPRALYSFSYEHVHCLDGYHDFPGHALGDSLRTHSKETLESLIIRIVDTNYLNEVLGIGNLYDFEKLHHLEISLPCLLSWDLMEEVEDVTADITRILPQNIETLVITDCDDGGEFHLCGHFLAAKNKRGMLPRLREITLRYDPARDGVPRFTHGGSEIIYNFVGFEIPPNEKLSNLAGEIGVRLVFEPPYERDLLSRDSAE